MNLCEDCSKTSCTCWQDVEEHNQKDLWWFIPIKSPCFAPVLMSTYALNPQGTTWLRIGLNASEGTFSTLIQLTDSKGEGSLLTQDEIHRMLHGTTWDWINLAFMDHTLMKGHTNKIRKKGTSSYRHRLIVSHTTPATVSVDLRDFYEIDGPLPCWSKKAPKDSKISLSEFEWNVLHEYRTLISDRCELLTQIAEDCKHSYNQLCEHAAKIIAINPEFVMAKIKSDDPISATSIQQYLKTSWLTCMYPPFLVDAKPHVQQMVHDLRAFHSRTVAFGVKELIAREPKCTPDECHCKRGKRRKL